MGILGKRAFEKKKSSNLSYGLTRLISYGGDRCIRRFFLGKRQRWCESYCASPCRKQSLFGWEKTKINQMKNVRVTFLFGLLVLVIDERGKPC